MQAAQATALRYPGARSDAITTHSWRVEADSDVVAVVAVGATEDTTEGSRKQGGEEGSESAAVRAHSFE